ncbi:hypothetical protein AAVH_23344 [Aphelenchoides avenae]|nr:hypothetical protein AAVH_23344 [Aphelenchus avenae]
MAFAAAPSASDLEPLLPNAMDTAEETAEKKPRKPASEYREDLKKYVWMIARPRTCLGPLFNCPDCSDFNYNNRNKIYDDGNYVWLNLRFCRGCAVGNIRQQLGHLADFPKKVWNNIKGSG